MLVVPGGEQGGGGGGGGGGFEVVSYRAHRLAHNFVHNNLQPFNTLVEEWDDIGISESSGVVTLPDPGLYVCMAHLIGPAVSGGYISMQIHVRNPDETAGDVGRVRQYRGGSAWGAGAWEEAIPFQVRANGGNSGKFGVWIGQANGSGLTLAIDLFLNIMRLK